MFHSTHRQGRIGFNSINLNNIYITPKISIKRSLRGVIHTSRTISSLSEHKPVIIYTNLDKEEKFIIEKNRDKSGVYR